MSRVIFVVVLMVALKHATASEPEDGAVPKSNEIVMSPGMTIIATTSIGTIKITAGKGLRRSYTWEGGTRSVEMWPRKERWYGSLGLYFPGPGEHWKEHNGITRGVVQEGQQHFKTIADATKWLNGLKGMSYVHRRDGLVVGWTKVPERKQLNVDVWQVYVGGKKPEKLPNSDDEAIVIKETRSSGNRD